MGFSVFKERILKLFLAIPIFDSLAVGAIDIFVKKIEFTTSFRLMSFSRKKKNKEYQKFSTKHNWLIWISAPSGEKSKLWGDTYFAQELIKELKNTGHDAQIIFRDQDPSPYITESTVLLSLRGLLPMHTNARCLNIIWVISHPDQISKRELKKYDLVFAASTVWSKSKSKKYGLEIKTLLQATNSELFNLESKSEIDELELLFIGNTRGHFRESVRVAKNSKLKLTVIGTGWEKFLPSRFIKNKFVSNHDISGLYRKSKFVLADHWKDMANNGFISNRLFDAVASGARVITDYVPGSREIFSSSILEYKNRQELSQLLDDPKLFEKFGTEEQIRTTALKVQSEHNFQIRTNELIKQVEHLIKK